jgi:hypothetical protein
MLLVTNNRTLCKRVKNVELVEGTSFDVLVRARNYIHKGWSLLTHPLYGNLRPYQHPFRSILLQAPSGALPSNVDTYSLELIENTISIYDSCKERILLVSSLADEMIDDYSFLDKELIKESLEKYSMFLSASE